MNSLRDPLTRLLEALSPLKVMNTPIANLDSRLAFAITEAVQALNATPPEPAEDAVQALAKAHAFARRSRHDRAENADHYWEHLGSETQAEELRATREALRLIGPLEDDSAYCIGCGTHPKGPYTCATCVAADAHEGPTDFVSDWPERTH